MSFDGGAIVYRFDPRFITFLSEDGWNVEGRRNAVAVPHAQSGAAARQSALG